MLIECDCDSHNSPFNVDDVTLGDFTTRKDSVCGSTQLQTKQVHDGPLHEEALLKERMNRHDLLTLLVDERHQGRVFTMAKHMQQFSFE